MTSPDLFGHVVGPPAPTEYIVYHDESKEPGYWHVFLFVPVGSRAMLLAALREALKNSKYKRADRSYKKIRESSAGHSMADYWLSILAASFQVRRGDGMLPYTTGRPLGREYPNPETILQFPTPPGCRMAVFCMINGHEDLDVTGRDSQYLYPARKTASPQNGPLPPRQPPASRHTERPDTDEAKPLRHIRHGIVRIA